jgi:protein ImuB
MAFACIFVPDFPVAALVRTQPELRTQAVAVLEGKAPLERVFAANEAGRRAGVKTGMAKAQLEACVSLILQPRSPIHEKAAQAALMDCAQSFSPRVEEVASDLLVLDLEGMEPLLGPLHRIARKLAMRAAHLGLKSNVAVASNPDSAMLAARGLPGITVIPAGKEAEQLAVIPVELLFEASASPLANEEPDAAAMLTTLHRWGIWNLRALGALPEVALVERLGQKGRQLQQLAQGKTFRTLVPVDPPMIFEETIEPEDPVVLLEPMAFLLDRMLGQICARLESRALATQELRLRLELDLGYKDDEDEAKSTKVLPETGSSPRETFERTLRLPLPLLDRNVFLKLLQLDLKAHPPGAPIRKIHLAAQPTKPRNAQSGLFQPPSPEPEKLELTLARIVGIVGEGNVGSLEMLDTHCPESFRMRHFCPETETAIGKRKTVRAASPNSSGKNPQELVTAMRIFRPPQPVSVVLKDGKPARIDCQRSVILRGEVIWMAGPWRFSGDWWEQEAWARDEWDIAVRGNGESGNGIALYRMVRDLLSGVWFLEGIYD